MTALPQRDDVLELCSKVEQKYQSIIDGDYHILIKKMAECMYTRSNEVKNICQVDRYDLYFSGKVGIGKSTLICMILGLIDYDKLVQGEYLSNVLLLKTGSGRTTVCETQIIPHATQTQLIVEEVPYEQFCIYLREFCDYILDQATSSISDEHIRFIKNMANIQLKADLEEICDTLSINISDSLDNKQKADLIFDKLLKICNYKERTDKVFTFSGIESNFATWCKENFAAINDGTISSAPMPQKIILKISDKDATIKIPSYIRSIVDTRGLEGGERPDIQNYISKSDSITMMCDSIKSYGSEEAILSILKQLLITEDRDKRYRVLLLGMEKECELEDITGFEDDRKGGMNKKIDEAIRVIKQNEIAFYEKNYIFANTAPSIEISKRKISSVSLEQIDVAQKEFWDNINKCLDHMWSQYVTELLNALYTLEKLRLNEIELAIMDKIKKCLENATLIYDELKNKMNTVLQLSKQDITSIFPSSLRGAVNHLGIGKTADVYGIFQKCCSSEFDKQCREPKNKIIHTNTIIFESPTELEKICLDFINREIDRLYQKYYIEYRKNIYDETYKKLYNFPSWSEAQRFWGDGQGSYRNRVWYSIQDQLISQGIKEILTSQQYMIKFAESIVSFLSI